MAEETRPDAHERGRGEPGSISGLRVFGIPVRFHFTFILLIIYLLVEATSNAQTSGATASYVVALFGSILIHEVAHALAARRFGIRTNEIVMLPIGGLARLERQAHRREEWWIALAGPVANLALGGLLMGYLAIAGKLAGMSELMKASDAPVLERIAVGNLVLGLFNLLPAFPMDGGRMLRALLAAGRPEDQATRIATRVGMVMAALLGLAGLLTNNFILVFVAFFIYVGNIYENMTSLGRSLMRGEQVRSAMVTDFRTLHHSDSIRVAADLLLATSQQDFPVLSGEAVVGLLNRTALLRAMATEGPDVYVAGSMTREFVSLSPDMDLADAAPLLAKAGSCAMVFEADKLVGLLTTENLSEFLVLRRISRGVSKSYVVDNVTN
jgi:Zn-dependent protease/CBS domain-containing protein